MKKMDIKVYLVSANYPNEYYNWTPWNKMANISISEVKEIKTEIIAPLPFSIPFKYLPYNNLYNIPKIEYSQEGRVHRPRFLYLFPKNIFYSSTGEFYKKSISHYLMKNLEKPDIIHAHQSYMDGYGLIDICERWLVPLVVDIHSSDSILTWLNNFAVKKKLIKTLNYATRIMCISQSLSSMIQELGIAPEKIKLVPMGVDIDKFKPRNKEEIRKEMRLNDEKIILFVGLLIKRKGIDYLLKAVSNLLESRNDFKVMIIGDGPEKKNLMSLTKKLGLEKVLNFVGEVKGENLLKWYSLADIFVLASHAEGRPIAIYEAMASECAVVATNVDGIPEQVKDGYNGFLIEPRDIVRLADKIKFLLDNESLMDEMGKNGRKRIIDEEWTWEGYTKRVVNIYKEIV